MSETKPSMPAQPTTTQLPAKTDRALLEDLIRTTKEGFSTVTSRLDTMETNLELQGGTVRDVARRMTDLEGRVVSIETRQTTNSERVKQSSKVDLEHESAIAILVADVASLKETQSTQLTILTRLDAVAANPMVRRVAYAIGGAILSYLAAKGWLTR